MNDKNKDMFMKLLSESIGTNQEKSPDDAMSGAIKEIAKMTKSLYDCYLAEGFSKDDSFELALAITQTLVMGGIKQ